MTGIVTVTLNPSLDLSVSVPRIVPTRKLRCTMPRRDPGGGGINVARVVKRLGLEVSAVYPAGGLPGSLLHRLLEEEGIRSVPLEIANETREDFTALDEATGEQYRFVLPGPEMSEGELNQVLDRLASQSSRPAYVVASGSLPPGAPEDFYGRIARVVRGLGARFVVDTSGAALEHALSEGAYLVKPNLGELRRLAGRALASEDEWRDAALALVRDGRAEAVALTLGERGALLATRAGAFAAAALKVAVKSAVGAGDSFLAAMVAALARGRPIEDAFRFGVAAGSAALLQAGTELCHPDDVERLYPSVRLMTV